jgi:hypothetical protein
LIEISDLPALNAMLNAFWPFFDGRICFHPSRAPGAAQEVHARGTGRVDRIFLRRTSSATPTQDRDHFPARAAYVSRISSILVTHVFLAATILPLELTTTARGLRAQICATRENRTVDPSDLAVRFGHRRRYLLVTQPALLNN